MKKTMLVVSVILSLLFLPSIVDAGICTDNYNSVQSQLDAVLEVGIINCDVSDIDCEVDHIAAHAAGTMANTAVWAGCCYVLGWLNC